MTGPGVGSGSEAPELWLARHGQTDDNLDGDIFQGFRDTPLNDTGREQAHRLAEKLAARPERRFASLFCSDLARAHETASIVGAEIGLDPLPDARLREGDRGRWEGRRFSDIQREEPERFADWMAGGPQFRFPGGESLLEQQTRVLGALEEYRSAAVGPVLVVCHRGSIRVALCARDPRGLFAFHDHDVANTGLVPF